MFSRVISFFSNHLERKLALLLSLVALCSLLVLAWLAIPTITATREKDIIEIETKLVEQRANSLLKYMTDKVDNFQISVLDSYVQGISQQQETYLLNGLLKQDDSLTEASVILVGETNFPEEIRLNPQGEGLEGRVFSTNDLFIATALKGQNYIGPVFYTELENKPRLIIASPIINQVKKVIAILRGEVDLTKLSSLVVDANLGETGYFYVMDQTGRLITSSINLRSAGRAWLNIKPAEYIRFALYKALRLPGVSSGNKNNVSASFISSYTNEEVFSVARNINKLGWAAVAEWPREEAMGPVVDVELRLLLALFGLLAILVVASIWLARGVTKPLRELRGAAELVGQGKFEVLLKARGHDEVGELARSFKQMTEGLKELEKLKDEFVFIAAHELRTPVAAIRGYSEMLSDISKSVPEQGKEFITRLQQAGARLATLVNDLLEVARNQAGRLKVITSPQDLLSLIKVTLAEVDPLVKEKQHDITFNPPPSVPQVMADKDKLQEVLVNLISNAIKYTPQQGKINIGIEVKNTEVVISVADSGIGISPENQAKLFQRFFRVESDKTKSIQGTGLGLFIVRQLVERMGGKIWVTSIEGRGSTFSFTLPKA